jgi:hypothetical protein
MSGIIGSRFNHRGSGLTGSLGTDGQLLTSAGAGLSAVYENVASGTGKVLQVITDTTTTEKSTTSASWQDGDLTVTITPTSSSNKVFLMISTTTAIYVHDTACGIGIDRSGGASGNGTLGGQTYGLTRNHYPWNRTHPTSYPNDDNPAHAIYVDSPAVATAVVYTFQFKAKGVHTVRVNTGSTIASLTAMEIEG